MRRKDKLRPEAEAWALLAAAPSVHLAAVLSDGSPLIRALHGVVHEGGLVFHGAPKGEKVDVMAGPAVVTAERIVAEIPSWFTHPERACPATTFFHSAMVHGRLRALEDLDEKAAALQALMVRYQPDGKYVPITASDPMYAASVRGVAVWRLEPERVVAKSALGLHKDEAWRRSALRGLWQTGQLKALRELSSVWGMSCWPAVSGAQLLLPGAEHVDGAVGLLTDQYWNQDDSDARIAEAHRGGSAWVGAVDSEGRLIATARAIADGAKLAYVMDVAVHPAWRGRGVGAAVMAVLLDHPRVRGCRRTVLHTRDAGPFYATLGFEQLHPPAWRQTWRRLA